MTVALLRLSVAPRLRMITVSRTSFSRQAVEAKEVYVVTGQARGGEIGHDFADHAGELEAVPRTRRGEAHLRIFRVQVYDEMVVWGVGEHAGLKVHRGPATVREVPLGEATQYLFLSLIHISEPTRPY